MCLQHVRCDAARHVGLLVTADPCYYSYLFAAIWPISGVVVKSSFRISEPNRGLSKTEPNKFCTNSAVLGAKPNRKSKINSADP